MILCLWPAPSARGFELFSFREGLLGLYIPPLLTVMTPDKDSAKLSSLSIVIPARNEESCIASTVEHLTVELRIRDVPHEIIVVDDGSTDRTWEILDDLKSHISTLVPVQNKGDHGFGRAVIHGLDQMHGD